MIQRLIICILSISVTCWAQDGDTFCDERFGMGDTTCLNYPDDCDGNEKKCNVTMSAQLQGGIYTIHMSRRLKDGATTGWVALGFSADRSMDDDDIIMCVRDKDENITVGHRFTNHHNCDAATELGDNLVLNMSSFEDGVLSCSVTRTATISNKDTYDLTKKWFLLFGSGPVDSDDDPIRHWKNPYISDRTLLMSEKNLVNISISLCEAERHEHHHEDGHDHDHDHDYYSFCSGAEQPTAGVLLVIGLVMSFQTMFSRN